MFYRIRGRASVLLIYNDYKYFGLKSKEIQTRHDPMTQLGFEIMTTDNWTCISNRDIYHNNDIILDPKINLINFFWIFF